MKELSEKEYNEIFHGGNDTVYIRKYYGEILSKVLSEMVDMKYCEKGNWWYGEWENHRRKVVKIFSHKGMLYPIGWGYNYDFIPDVGNGDKITYHRTEKSFAMHVSDYCIHHIDYDSDTMTRNETFWIREQYMLSIFANRLYLNEALEYTEHICRKNMPFMQEWFERVQTDDDVLAELDRQIARPAMWGHWGEYYVKAFLLAKQKRLAEAEEMLSLRYDGHPNEKILAKLRTVSEPD